MGQDDGRSLSGRATAKRIPAIGAKARSRFWAKVDKRGDGDCWHWAAAKSGSGYGSFYLAGKMYQAHRIALSLAGYSVPTAAVVDHVCRNRICVNPMHLRTVDRFTNVHENSDAPAHINSLKTHCPKGHAYSGDNLAIRKSGSRRRCRQCEAEYQRKRRMKNAG